jgi:hypothetical protein
VDWFTAKTKRSGTVLSNAFVIIQWLLHLQRTSRRGFCIPDETSELSAFSPDSTLAVRRNWKTHRIAAFELLLNH